MASFNSEGENENINIEIESISSNICPYKLIGKIPHKTTGRANKKKSLIKFKTNKSIYLNSVAFQLSKSFNFLGGLVLKYGNFKLK